MRKRRATLTLWPEYGGSLGTVSNGRRGYELRVDGVAALGLPAPLAAELLVLHEVATGEGSAGADDSSVRALDRLTDEEFVRWSEALAVRIGTALGDSWTVRLDPRWVDE